MPIPVTDAIARAASLGAAAWLSRDARVLLIEGAHTAELRSALARDEIRGFFSSVGSSSYPVASGVSLHLECVDTEHAFALLIILQDMDVPTLARRLAETRALFGRRF